MHKRKYAHTQGECECTGKLSTYHLSKSLISHPRDSWTVSSLIVLNRR